MERVRAIINRLVRKHSDGTIALVVPEPVASLVRAIVSRTELGDLWKAECECGGWQMLDARPETVALAS